VCNFFPISALPNNFSEGLLEEKDVVLYATSGIATMLPDAMATQPANDRPDGFVIHTVFLGKIPEKGTPWWMIMLAIILGLLILLLIIVALIKVRCDVESSDALLELIT
jgi:hypothetical protein